MSKWQSERSIHEMLKDTPALQESSDSITSGTEAKFPASKSMNFPPAYDGPTSSTLSPAASKLDSLKNWSLSTYKCTKQVIFEKLGKTSRTVDTELEAGIVSAREWHRRLQSLSRQSQCLVAQLAQLGHSQRNLAHCFADLAQRAPELQQPFIYNADTQRTLTRNGETLIAALQFFNNSLDTLVNKTIEDTMLTVRLYENARLEMDASRADGTAVDAARVQTYQRLRDDVSVKLALLKENQIKVLNKQLLLFHNAIAAYFSGNSVALEATMKHFNIHSQVSASPPPATNNSTT